MHYERAEITTLSTYNDYHATFNSTSRIYFVTFMYFPSPLRPITRIHFTSFVEMWYVNCFCVKLKNSDQDSHHKTASLGEHHRDSMILFEYQFNHWSLFLIFSPVHFFPINFCQANSSWRALSFCKHIWISLLYMYDMHTHTQKHTCLCTHGSLWEGGEEESRDYISSRIA